MGELRAHRALARLAGALLVAALPGLGCGGDREPVDAAPERRTASGVRLGGTFRWVEVEDMRSLDPTRAAGDIVSYHIAMNVYDGLVEFDQDLRLRPALAQRWDLAPDGLAYTFHLRPGVRFHDDPAFPGGQGRVVTAEDVRYSLLRVADRSNNSMGWWSLQGLIQGLDEYREKGSGE
ncbi:MAG: hypothetical protein H0V09_09895, partial [Gemmatimonadetes bacterium]|nr:hypothetical protein [Gemmatimonadota bacterium]